MPLLIQGLSVVAILLIGYLVFRFDPLHITIQKLTIASMFIVIATVLQLFSVMLPLFGFPSLRIGFSQLPLMMIGVMLGPAWAFVSGIVQDFVGLIITPTNYPFFGFTLNKIVIALIPAILFSKSLKLTNKQLYFLVQITLVVFLAGSISYLWLTDFVVANGEVVTISNGLKIILTTLSIILTGLMMIMIRLITLKFVKFEAILPISIWALSVVLVEIVVQLVLTPIWLMAMYNIPILVSFLIRVVKATVMVPLFVVIGYGLLLVIQRFKVDKGYHPKKEI